MPACSPRLQPTGVSRVSTFVWCGGLWLGRDAGVVQCSAAICSVVRAVRAVLLRQVSNAIWSGRSDASDGLCLHGHQPCPDRYNLPDLIELMLHTVFPDALFHAFHEADSSMPPSNGCIDSQAKLSSSWLPRVSLALSDAAVNDLQPGGSHLLEFVVGADKIYGELAVDVDVGRLQDLFSLISTSTTSCTAPTKPLSCSLASIRRLKPQTACF